MKTRISGNRLSILKTNGDFDSEVPDLEKKKKNSITSLTILRGIDASGRPRFECRASANFRRFRPPPSTARAKTAQQRRNACPRVRFSGQMFLVQGERRWMCHNGSERGETEPRARRQVFHLHRQRHAVLQ